MPATIIVEQQFAADSVIASDAPQSLWFFSLALDYAEGVLPKGAPDLFDLPYDTAMEETRQVLDVVIPEAVAEAGEEICSLQDGLFYGPGLRRARVVPVANFPIRATTAGAARLADTLLMRLRLREVIYYRRAMQK